ncbi:hypothetical protein OJ996_19820 [Luteolibacter sp. GHJ8]|uniref:Tetratricopeptide repeat protein n=1 Tax=Luteolibacter rhizosphaerae TaxID=2989719 RepID=A0ABT3G9G8_9BACT|nr:hypothetical protein [Luteolibacter rhizosphaerae]MCW1915845.1 hypothetical protein [Luteolibacter rhizosphaerae]
MGWQEDLAEGEKCLDQELWKEAYRIAEKLNRDLTVLPSVRMFCFMFKSACMVRATAWADALAKKMAVMSEDRAKFTAASWYHTLAAEAWAGGRQEDAYAYLDECLAIAPGHRATFLADPRLGEMLPGFDNHEKGLNPLAVNPPPPKPDYGPVPPLAIKAYTKAAELVKRKRYPEAWEIMGRLRVNDFHRREPLILAFHIACGMQNGQLALGLCELLRRGDAHERELAADFYRRQAIAAIEAGKRDTAGWILKDALKGMADFRDYFSEDPRLAVLIASL